MEQNIDADWARNESNNILESKILFEIAICNDAIKSAVKKNEMMVYVQIYAHKRTIEDLKKHGFKVEQHDSQHDGASLQINW